MVVLFTVKTRWRETSGQRGVKKKRNGKAVYERKFLEFDVAGFGGVRPYLSRWDLS